MPHWHKAFLGPEFRFQTLPVTGTEEFFNPFFSFYLHFLTLPSLFSCRALHWVTPQMLCVPVSEEIPEVSDMVVKAITGLWVINSAFPAFNLTSLACWDDFCCHHRVVQAVKCAGVWNFSCGAGMISTLKGLELTDLLETLPHTQKWCNKCNKWCSELIENKFVSFKIT